MQRRQQTRRAAAALAIAMALIAPAAATAALDERAALAQESYYSSYGKSGPPPISEPAPAPAPEVAGDPGAWKVVALGTGALVLVLGVVELVTLSRLRRATAI